MLPIPDRGLCRAAHLRREGSGVFLPAHPAVASTTGCPERDRRTARRCRVRRVVGVRRAVQQPRPPERLAGGGLKYSRFHTTALCSPTRQALLTGRNHHSVGMGGITEISTSAPGYNSIRPNTAAPLAEILKLNGYSTAQFGKCHEGSGLGDEPDGPIPTVADR